MEIRDLWLTCLTLILLTWRIWWAPNNASKWQMEFNSAFKGLICKLFWPATSRTWTSIFVITHWYISCVSSPHIPTFRAHAVMTDDWNWRSFKVSPKKQSHRLMCSVQSVGWPVSAKLWWAVWGWEITLGPKVSCRKSEALSLCVVLLHLLRTT
jgi:hypothetical protein